MESGRRALEFLWRWSGRCWGDDRAWGLGAVAVGVAIVVVSWAAATAEVEDFGLCGTPELYISLGLQILDPSPEEFQVS